MPAFHIFFFFHLKLHVLSFWVVTQFYWCSPGPQSLQKEAQEQAHNGPNL